VTVPAGSLRLFRLLDRLFWLVWLGLPFMIYMTVRTADGAQLDALFDAADQACMEAAPTLGRMSAAGRSIWWTALIVQYSIYAVLLFLAHRMIHRFAGGRILVTETLGGLRGVALIITAYPFYDLVSRNLLTFGLATTGDLKAFLPDPGIDVTVLGVGLLILTLVAALRHAVTLQQDADLTI